MIERQSEGMPEEWVSLEVDAEESWWRELPSRAVSLVVHGVGKALGAAGVVLTIPSEPRVTRLDIRIPDLPVELDGFCIAHVSDLHAGPGAWMPASLQQAAQVVQSAVPDIVVNTGDFVQETPAMEKVVTTITPFLVESRSDSRGPANVAVLGNHDYMMDEESIAELTTELERAGICVLENWTTRVGRAGATISIVGLTADVPGFQHGLRELLSAPRPRIALLHDPDLVDRLPPGSVDLVLAGHTHGGQIAVPGLRAWIVRAGCGSHYVQGMYHVNGIPMYINEGIGCTGAPLRIGVPPEVALVRLLR